MLTNMESQLREQGAANKFDEVMHENYHVSAKTWVLFRW